MMAYEGQGKMGDGLAYLEQAVAENPAHPIAYAFLGRLYLSQKKTKEAADALEKGITVNPGWGTSYVLLGQLYYDDGRKDQAVQTFQSGLDAAPKDIVLRMKLAEIYQKDKDFEGAIAVYKEILGINPNLVAVKNDLASLLSDYRPDKEGLEEALELAVDFDKSDSPFLLDTLGWIHFRLNQLDKALPILEKAAEKSQNIPVISYHLGATYNQLGDKEKAKTNLEIALKDNPDFPGVEEARALLVQLK